MQLINLELGGGGQPIKTRDSSRSDYVNMDAFDLPGVDIVHDAIVFPWPFQDNSVSNIFSSEFMEHISYHALPGLLKEAYRVLTPGGKFAFECPDFEGIIAHLVLGGYSTEQDHYMKRGIWGDHSREFDFHRNGLTFGSMAYQFAAVGFEKSQRYPAPLDRIDYQELRKQFSDEFIQSVKLCMTATKPNE